MVIEAPPTCCSNSLFIREQIRKKLKHLKVESIIKNLQQELHQFSFRDPMRGIYPRQHTPGSLEHTNTHDNKVVIHGDSKVRGFRHDQLGADLRADLGHAGVSLLAWEHLRVPPEELEEVDGEGKV